jgi:hypothetical protein
MRYLLILASVAILPACGGRRGPDVTHGVPASYTTDLLVQATNHDDYDYALWLEWQDSTGAWQLIELFYLYGDPAVGPTMDFNLVVASPELPYTVLLTDPIDGYVYDSYILWLPYGSFSDVRFQVIGGVLVRPS